MTPSMTLFIEFVHVTRKQLLNLSEMCFYLIKFCFFQCVIRHVFEIFE